MKHGHVTGNKRERRILRPMTQADKLRNIVESMRTFQAHGITRTLADYGVADDSDLGKAITERLKAMSVEPSDAEEGGYDDTTELPVLTYEQESYIP